jgi:hypothetical protein
MIKVRLAVVLTITASGLSACGSDSEGEIRTDTVAAAETSTQDTSTSPPVNGDAVLIETRITDARRHAGQVLAGSVIGKSAFCRGGKTSGSSSGPTITTTFHCRRGTLRVRFAPTEPGSVQRAEWAVVDGTGDFEGLRGGGSMVARFERDDPDVGGETFTGMLGK